MKNKILSIICIVDAIALYFIISNRHAVCIKGCYDYGTKYYDNGMTSTHDFLFHVTVFVSTFLIAWILFFRYQFKMEKDALNIKMASASDVELDELLKKENNLDSSFIL